MTKKKPGAIKRGSNLPTVNKKTQFTKENQPTPKPESTKPWDIRNELRYIASQPLDMEDIDGSIKKLMKDKATEHGGFARAVAIRAFEKTLKKMEPGMFTSLVENTCGKQPQEVIIPSMAKAPEDYTDLEKAAQAYKEFIGS
jgi:hypothetical protein